MTAAKKALIQWWATERALIFALGLVFIIAGCLLVAFWQTNAPVKYADDCPFVVCMPGSADTTGPQRAGFLAILAALMAGAMLAVRGAKQARLARRLQKSEESLRRAQAVAAIGSWEFDALNNRVTWSEEEYRIHGVPLGSPVSYETVLNLVHPLDRQRLDEAWRAATVPDGDVYDVVHRIIVDGKIKWVRALAEMHFDERGRVVHMIGTTQDITDRKRDEDELKQHRDHLEELVAQRTLELSESNQRLQVANAAKTAFLARMSHELRTPLNGILGYAQILQREGPLTERQRTGLATIQKSGEHLLSLITDLLDLSKIEAEKLDLYLSPVELAPFISVVGEIVRMQAEEKGLAFVCEVAPGVPRAVMIDEKRVRQILLNLLGNAVKFTSSGQVALKLASTPRGAGLARLHFEVFDTGVGIEPDQFEMIFQPFEQVGSLQQRCAGAGLGLSISRQLARMMDTDIQVSSVPGKGSRFSFDLEVSTIDAGAASQPILPPGSGHQVAAMSILIVDDAPVNAAILSDLLQGQGFSVSLAADGEQGLRAVATLTPDLILMDLMMPVMDGLEAIRRIRSNPDMKRMPIVAMSANVSRENQEASLAAGADAFVGKPIDQIWLLREIEQRLGLNVEACQASE